MCYAGVVPRFEPFRGLRYAPSVAPLADLIAPPYDVVDAAERAQLAARSPYNSIHVELPAADSDRGLDRYQAAAALFAAWRTEGVLATDPSPSLYVYQMGYLDDSGRSLSTTGVIGALGLEPFGGAVLPHEKTMSAPGRDRLQLLRSCRVNCSPIWGLSLAAGLSAACSAAIDAAAQQVRATDDELTTHEVWRVDDESVVREIAALVTPAPVIIADGHHRHETAIRYRAECRSRHPATPGDCDLIMAFLTELAPDELALRPIHRLVGELPPDLDLVGALARLFRAEPASNEPDTLAAEMASQGTPALVTSGGSWLLFPTTEDPSRLESLDAASVDTALAGLPRHRTDYVHDTGRAWDAVRSSRAQAALLVRAATVNQLAETVRRGTRMPPKSTYFHPKPRTGFVFRALDD